jgi:hypothetical protein
MSEKDEQASENAGAAVPGLQPVRAITSDPKVAEYKEQINARGVRFQRIAGAVVGVMLLLLFGFILPIASSKAVTKLSKLRRDRSELEQKIKDSGSKMAFRQETSKVRKGAVLSLAPRQALDTKPAKNHRKMTPDQMAEQPVETSAAKTQAQPSRNNNERRRLEVENRRQLTRVNDELQRLEEEVRDLDYDKSAEERLNPLKTLKDSVRSEVGKLQELQGKEGIEADPYRAIQARATELLDKVKLEILNLREEALSSRKVPLDALGVFGFSAQVLKEPELPILYLPLLWSILLLGFLLFRVTSRTSLLNLYARLVRRSLAVDGGALGLANA